MSATTPLYDLYIGDVASLQGFRCRNITRDSAPLVASRFSTGEAGQTDLDLLKSASIDDMAGGMFQRDWVDPEKVARAVGVYNPYDKNVYPVPPGVATTWTGISTSQHMGVKVESESYSFFTLADFSAGTYYNTLVKIDKSSGNFTNIALPAGLASNTVCNITCMVLHKGALFLTGQTIGGGGLVDLYRYDIDAGTFQNIGGGGCLNIFEMRGNLYTLNKNSLIASATNEMAAGAATYTGLTTVGNTDLNSLVTDAKEFNGAAWIAKSDGIYRFDGVTAVKVLGLVTYQLQVFNGALYFVSGNWLYKFDGASVTRLQFVGQEIFGTTYQGSMSLSASTDYLFMQTSVLTSAFQGDKVSTATALTRIYTYDGVGFMLLNETAATLSTYMQGLVYCGGRIYDLLAQFAFTSWAIAGVKYQISNFFLASAVTSASKLEFTSSEFDDGFPNIYKSLEIIEATYSGLIAGDSLAVSYQLYDGKTWSSWITAGTLTSTTGNTLEIQGASNKLFKRLKINMTLTTAAGSTASVKGGSIRYTLQPRARWRWQPLIMAEANGTITDRLGGSITGDANAFTNSVLKAVKQKTPLFMLGVDYGLVKTGINNTALSFIVKGQAAVYTDPYNEYPLCAVKNNAGVWEVLRVSAVSYNSGTDETTITVIERGYYGVTAGTINANAEFRLAYKVYITRLLRDQPVLDDPTYNEQTSGESQLNREFLLEVTEV